MFIIPESTRTQFNCRQQKCHHFVSIIWNPLTATIYLQSWGCAEEETRVRLAVRVMPDDFYLKTHLKLISTPLQRFWENFLLKRGGTNLHREKFEIKISPESVAEQTNEMDKGFVYAHDPWWCIKGGESLVPCAYLHSNFHLGPVVCVVEVD